MGQVVSRRERQRRTDETNDAEQQLAFTNSNGAYFGSHFLMCGCKFELAKPEAYLFGENSDLDLFAAKPIDFPYPLGPLGNNEIRPLNLLVNIRKESVRFVRIADTSKYRLHFIMDADCKCSVQIHYMARDVCVDDSVGFVYKNKKHTSSEKYYVDMGSEISFTEYVFNMGKFHQNDVTYLGGLFFPFVIAVETEGDVRKQVQITMCSIDVFTDVKNGGVILKPLRQKICCDGVSYLQQEIFGIENKDAGGVELDDGGLECIICMSDVRDTVILPCRHLCICSNCADTLRYKLNNCPLCRSPFRALVRLRAHRQTRNQIYETVSLVEGLNGASNGSTGIMNEIVISDAETSKARRSTKNRKGLHQVLTMNELADDTSNSKNEENGECIEMKCIAPSENGQSSCTDLPEPKHFSPPTGKSTSMTELRRVESDAPLTNETPQEIDQPDSSSSLLEDGENKT